LRLFLLNINICKKMEQAMASKNFLTDFFSLADHHLPEKNKRIVAASMAESLGHGGIKKVVESSGVSRSTIIRGIKQLKDKNFESLPPMRQRNPGGGRKNLVDSHPEVKQALDELICPHVRGDPMSPLRWTTKSLRRLANELVAIGMRISHMSVGGILRDMGYTLQSCKKSHEGVGSPDRNAQFEHINKTCGAFMCEEQPVISVDAKKKEMVGSFKNAGCEYRPKGAPIEVNAYDFANFGTGRATPYGVYDINRNEGFVNVGISSDTADFAVESISKWWRKMGRESYRDAHSLYVNADGGGSNGARNRLWKKRLQEFSNHTGLAVYVSHFPPATSKWNKIEHRLFSAITMNWRGRPLDSFQTIVNLIANTTNKSNLKVRCALDEKEYATGIKVMDHELEKINIMGHSFHPEWNYVIRPNE
jgi:transposase